MKNRTSLKSSRARGLASAIVRAAAVAGVFGMLAGPADAARAHNASHFKHPKLKHGVLTVKGTRASDRIALRLKAGDPATLQVDLDDDGSADFHFRRADIAKIVVKARAGDDVIRMDESNGAFTDTIPTPLDGGRGDDQISGGRGVELLVGADGNDTIDGNQGNDRALLGAGDDTFIWDPGDGSDVVEGQDGADTMRFNGANIAERFELSANGGRLRFSRDIGNITMDTDDVEQVDLNALGAADLVTVHDLSGTDVTRVNVDESNPAGSGLGDAAVDQVVVEGTNGADTINVNGDASAVAASGLQALVTIQHPEASDKLAVDALGGKDTVLAAALPAQVIDVTIDGGNDDDTLAGSRGAELLLGADGNDTIDGNQGNDRALLGAGDDTFIWDPGDGSDVVEGQDGADTMRFHGANIAERFELSANGPRLRFSRDIGNITMDTDDVEQVDLNALGAADLVTVHDLSGTDVTRVNVDESNPAGSGLGDAAVDQVVVEGTNGADTINVNGDASAVAVSGLQALVTIQHPEASDKLAVDALDGKDTVLAAALPAQVIDVTIDGGNDDDTLAGSRGAELLLGADGNDTIDGNQGNDRALLGAGDDTFIWDPGDGSDVVEGQDGADTMRFHGANIAERFELSANGPRLRFSRDIGNITMDTDDVEQVDLNALGAADLVTVHDLSGTDVTRVNVDESNPAGSGLGDAAVDQVVVEGTNGADTINVNGDASAVAVSGLQALVTIQHPEASDKLAVDALDGDDTVSAASLPAQVIDVTIDGDNDDDTPAGSRGAELLLGADGNDTIDGNQGNDRALLGAGDDTFIWDPGDGSDVVEGQDGADTMRFNGANIAERFELSANGPRLRFSRDIGNITMDTDDVEQVDLNALGAADLVTVHDLSGTDVTRVNVDESNPAGSGLGDAAVDQVVVEGTNGADVVSVNGDASAVDVSGLQALVTIQHPEASDKLAVDA